MNTKNSLIQTLYGVIKECEGLKPSDLDRIGFAVQDDGYPMEVAITIAPWQYVAVEDQGVDRYPLNSGRSIADTALIETLFRG